MLLCVSGRHFFTGYSLWSWQVFQERNQLCTSCGSPRVISWICIDDGTVRNVVSGTIVNEGSWEEVFCQLLIIDTALTQSTDLMCVLWLKLGPFLRFCLTRCKLHFTGCAQNVSGLNFLWSGVTCSHLFGVELYAVVKYTPNRLESGRNCKVLEKIPGLNAVIMSLLVFML